MAARGAFQCGKCIVADFCLYATEFRVERYAELAPEFFGIYAEKLCRHSHTFTIPGQDAQSASIPRMFFPVGWKRQPEEGGIGPGVDAVGDVFEVLRGGCG